MANAVPEIKPHPYRAPEWFSKEQRYYRSACKTGQHYPRSLCMSSVCCVSLFRPGKGQRHDVEVRHPLLSQLGWPERTAASVHCQLSGQLAFKRMSGNLLIRLYSQEMGVLQGSVLSVLLFILKINSIVTCLPDAVRCSSYMDDFLICFRSRYMPTVERTLKVCWSSIQTWTDESGFRFSRSKTVFMHFC
jgi:hypothetical protein